jgi:hypothetical protein
MKMITTIKRYINTSFETEERIFEFCMEILAVPLASGIQKRPFF